MKKGEKLKEIIAKGMSVEDFAASINVSVSSVFKYYNKANFDSSLLEKFCSILKVPITCFFDDNVINQEIKGNSNIVVGRDNNGHISISECQDKLSDALLEIRFLKERMKDKEEMIEILKSQLSK